MPVSVNVRRAAGHTFYTLGLKKVFDWRNPTDPCYPADPRYFY